MAGRAAECDVSRGVVRRLWAAAVPYGQALRDPLHRKVLVGAALLSILIAALFAIPVVNYSVIGPFWFLLKVSAIIYLMIWFRARSRATATIS